MKKRHGDSIVHGIGCQTALGETRGKGVGGVERLTRLPRTTIQQRDCRHSPATETKNLDFCAAIAYAMVSSLECPNAKSASLFDADRYNIQNRRRFFCKVCPAARSRHQLAFPMTPHEFRMIAISLLETIFREGVVGTPDMPRLWSIATMPARNYPIDILPARCKVIECIDEE